MKKLSEVRPCDNCGGPILPVFWVIRTSPAVIKQTAINNTLGLMQMLGSMALAEVFTPEPDAVSIAMDEPEHKDAMVEIVLCNTCYCGEIILPVLAEKIGRKNGT